MKNPDRRSIHKSMKKNQKILLGITAAAALAAAGVAIFRVKQAKKTELLQTQPLVLPNGFTMTAHAGALDTEANTPESVEACLKFIGTGCIEVDIYFEAQQRPVLTHDAPKAGETYPLLQDVLPIMAQYPAHINLDLKDISNAAEIQRLGEEAGILERLFFTGVFAAQIEIVRTEAPRIPCYINDGVPANKRQDAAYLQTLAKNIRNMGAVGINLHFGDASALLVETMHANGLLVSVWTVNQKADMCKMLLLGVDNITSKRPDILKNLVQNWGE